MEVKENPRPREVQYQLHSEQSQGWFGGLESGRLPDEPCCDTHHDIQRRPERTEHVARRIPRWLLDRLVPTVDLGPWCNCTKATSSEADSQGNGKHQEI